MHLNPDPPIAVAVTAAQLQGGTCQVLCCDAALSRDGAYHSPMLQQNEFEHACLNTTWKTLQVLNARVRRFQKVIE